jgi:hypothetical protein
MGIFDKARDATEAAATRAAELREQAGDVASTFTERATSSVREQTTDLAAGLRERAGTLSAGVADATIERAKVALADFNAALPILKLAGYTVSEVGVELGIPPKIVASFANAEAVPDEQVEEMLKQHEDAPFASVLVRALMGARKLQNAVKVGGLRPKGLALNIGLSPSVVVRFG